MPTKREIIDALRKTDERVARLADGMRSGSEVRLPRGDWTVRDALCHLAARSNSVPMVIGLAERAAQIEITGGQGAASVFPEGFDIDAVNQGQLDERQRRSVDELIEEIRAGHGVAIDEITRLSDDIFEQRVPNPLGEGDLGVSDFLNMATAYHDNAHLNDIEEAIG